jgi:hypothetical protein
MSRQHNVTKTLFFYAVLAMPSLLGVCFENTKERDEKSPDGGRCDETRGFTQLS